MQLQYIKNAKQNNNAFWLNSRFSFAIHSKSSRIDFPFVKDIESTPDSFWIRCQLRFTIATLLDEGGKRGRADATYAESGAKETIFHAEWYHWRGLGTAFKAAFVCDSAHFLAHARTHVRTHVDPVVPLNWLFPRQGGMRRGQTRTKEPAQSPAKGIRPIEIRLPFVSVRTDVIPLAAVRRLAKTNFLVTMMRWFRMEPAKSALRRKVEIPTRANARKKCIQTRVHR